MIRFIKWFMKWNARKKFLVLTAYVLYVFLDQVFADGCFSDIWSRLALLGQKKQI
ncbi:hypothetical protein acsn021_21940 [Anaerocolumna cellulosilytica]|uniref:Uncharacterized protein n=1 Tax=Anaerocolumna cellulosilytica TaxID=433286 RepID=A0A6S6R5E3_9FIRM|nr:hypothetical protein [Anaerocolumna cellulosilytica]MBB5194163.1 hypothetical protein [Anaerocolumna cellulosilytica]BCJ94625.1 hypothetical protein acsn021_21940 [Anaerocolumna cellulosilytica]